MNAKGTVKYDIDAISRRRSIVVYANNTQIANIKSMLALDSNQVKDLGNSIYKLEIDPINVDVPEILYNMSVEEFEGTTSASTVKVVSFRNSKKFYAGASGKNGHKIVSDEFSDGLNLILYKGFNRIESELRQLVIENKLRKGGLQIDSRFYKAKNRDHAISTFQLSDFIERLLKAPASDGYMKMKWRESTKTDDDVIKVAKLTRLDEIQPGLTFEELNDLRNQRNKCMHFNVVTIEDYKKIAPLINKYLRASATRMMSRTFQELYEALSKQLEQITMPAKALSELLTQQFRPVSDLSDYFRDMTDKKF